MNFFEAAAAGDRFIIEETLFRVAQHIQLDSGTLHDLIQNDRRIFVSRMALVAQAR